MLELRQLSVFYGDAQALDRVDLSVRDGEIVALVGANGAGKTSLIRTVAGILKPRSGSIVFDGKSIGGLDSHRVCDAGIGQVAEEAAAVARALGGGPDRDGAEVAQVGQ